MLLDCVFSEYRSAKDNRFSSINVSCRCRMCMRMAVCVCVCVCVFVCVPSHSTDTLFMTLSLYALFTMLHLNDSAALRSS